MVVALKECEACNGTGVVPLANHTVGMVRSQELCAPCGGSGKVTDWGGKPQPLAWKKPGYVADQIGE